MSRPSINNAEPIDPVGRDVLPGLLEPVVVSLAGGFIDVEVVDVGSVVVVRTGALVVGGAVVVVGESVSVEGSSVAGSLAVGVSVAGSSVESVLVAGVSLSADSSVVSVGVGEAETSGAGACLAVSVPTIRTASSSPGDCIVMVPLTGSALPIALPVVGSNHCAVAPLPAASAETVNS